MDVANCFVDRPGGQHAEFSRVRRDASDVYDVAEVKYFVSEKLALGKF